MRMGSTSRFGNIQSCLIMERLNSPNTKLGMGDFLRMRNSNQDKNFDHIFSI
jgi:hypothetical protein